MKLTFNNDAYILDVLDIALKHGIKKGFFSADIANLFKEEEIPNNLITDDNVHLTTFGKKLFNIIGVTYTSEPTDDGYIYTLTIDE
mgnify:CR=1 FL=1